MLILLTIHPLLPAEENPDRQISGMVVNGTFDNEPVAQAEVTLFIISEEAAESSDSMFTDDQGTFAFQRLPEGSVFSWGLTVAYQGITYYSGPFKADDEGSPSPVVLPVYEKSTDSSKLTISSHHLIIEREEGGLHVQEMLFLKNEVPYTYVPEDVSALEFLLPSGAHRISIADWLGKENVGVNGEAILLSIPIRPEGQEVSFSYDLTADDGLYALQRAIDLQTKQFDLFLGIAEAGVSSDSLERNEPTNIRGVEYQHFTARDLAQGDSVTIDIEVPLAAGETPGQRFLIIAALLIAAGALFFPFLKKHSGTGPETREDLASEKGKMVEEIAQLDYDFKHGNIKEDEYNSLRESKKEQLLNVVRQLESRNPA